MSEIDDIRDATIRHGA